MNHLKSILGNYRIWVFALIAFSLGSCAIFQKAPQKSIIKDFRAETGINVIGVTDARLLDVVESSQGSGDYPGVDDWVIVSIPAGVDLYGGLPGQSEYYTIDQTMVATDTMQVAYWESLQVKAHPQFGYRQLVGVFDLNRKTNVAIARTLANPQFGRGGAWQVYVENFAADLSILDTITLKK